MERCARTTTKITMSGKAFLVGAGPGHPGLITVRGLRVLKSAEVVLYDRLIARELLNEAHPNADMIFVGKRAGHHPKPQSEINRLLIAHVSAGKRVVRLKGGDVFVFSRGGEEVLALREHGLDFEVVPGLTSSIAAPAFAGMPVTQKGMNTSFTVMTGHEAPNKPETMIDWASLAKQEVLILLMSVKRIRSICASLLAAGKDAATPIALVSQGTTDAQQVLVGSLQTLPDLFDANPLPTPGIIVVGPIVALHQQIGWHQNIGLAEGFVEPEAAAQTKPSRQGDQNKSSVRVALVGAGPGAADLITVRGLDLLRKADVVLYDRLVNPRLLEDVRPDAELVNVGKSDKRDRFPQSEITRRLIAHSQSGRRVVRLKGGDPFVFGLGGDECLALREAAVPYEVVPGLSSVTAVPTHAGIPLTQRGVNTAFTVLSGHAGAAGWAHLPLHSTLVVLMGVRKLADIVSHLLAFGHDSDKPVAIIESGTLRQQRVTVGTLATIVERADGVSSPAMIVIGDVVALRAQMAWFSAESQPSATWGKAVR